MIENNEHIIAETVEIESRSEGDIKTDYIVGYAARFNQPSLPLAMWGDKGFIETIDSRAFDDVDMTKVIASVNHNYDKILARADKGTLSISVDAKGLKYEIKVPNTTTGKDTLEDVRNGNLSGSSFIFTTKEDKWTFNGKGVHDQRTVLKVGKLIELGPVTMPAYPSSSAAAAKRSYDEALKQKEEEERHIVDYKTIERKLRIHNLKNKK